MVSALLPFLLQLKGRSFFHFVGFFICVGVCVFMYIVAGRFCGIFFLCIEFFCALRKQILTVWDDSTSLAGPLAKAKREVVGTRSKMTESFAILCWVSRTTDGRNPDMLIFYHTPVILHSVRASEFLQCLILTVFCFLFFFFRGTNFFILWSKSANIRTHQNFPAARYWLYSPKL